MIAGIVVLVAGLVVAGYFFLYPMLKGGGGDAEITGSTSVTEADIPAVYETVLAPGSTIKLVLNKDGTSEMTTKLGSNRASVLRHRWFLEKGIVYVGHKKNEGINFRYVVLENLNLNQITSTKDGSDYILEGLKVEERIFKKRPLDKSPENPKADQ